MDTKPVMSTKQIVKIQRPLNGGSDCLVYAEGHVSMQTIDFSNLPKNVRKALDGRIKGFFYAIMENQKWKIGNQAPWQDW